MVASVSADVTSKKDIIRIFDETKIRMNRDPDYVFACAGKMTRGIISIRNHIPLTVLCKSGASYPKMFLDHSMEDFEFLANLNYLGQAYTAHVSTALASTKCLIILSLDLYTLHIASS
jgi:3-dehydrosphinganine reductase